MLGMTQIDVEVWGWTINRKGVVVVQEAIDPHLSVILGINVLPELDRKMTKEIRSLYWKR